MSKDKVTMNLAWLDKTNIKPTATETAVLLHEVGHVLGMLHEHRSAAHGKYAVMDIDATLKLYRKTQGWTDKQIQEQVIDVYKISDVSNFSQVDTESIIHYPEPQELTGLKEDVPYNQKLSDLDKAYMILQYPRAKLDSQVVKQGWGFEKALEVMGTPPDITEKVLDRIQKDRGDSSGEISPTNIRNILEDWTWPKRRDADADTRDPSKTVTLPDAGRPAHSIIIADTWNLVTAEVQDEQDLCGEEKHKVHAPASSSGQPAYAVTEEATRLPLPADEVAKPHEISYYLRVAHVVAPFTEPTM